MAGNFRTKGSNIASKVAGLAGAINEKKRIPAKKAHAEQQRQNKVADTKSIVSHAESQKRRTITHKGKIEVKTAQAKKDIRSKKGA
jgi:hypothetical protein